MKYYADKRMSNNFQKYQIGQNVNDPLLNVVCFGIVIGTYKVRYASFCFQLGLL
jgi:hypothetical protein